MFSCDNGVERDEWTQGIQRSRDSQKGTDAGVQYDLVSIDKEIDILTSQNEEDTSDQEENQQKRQDSLERYLGRQHESLLSQVLGQKEYPLFYTP